MPKLGSKRQSPTKAQREAAGLAAWHNSAEGRARYKAALDEAQRRANALGMDHGLEFYAALKTWSVRLLPAKQYRFGGDHTCAVIHPYDLARTLPGHGSQATRPPSTVGPDYHGGPFNREEALAKARAWESEHGPMYPATTEAQRKYEASLDRERAGYAWLGHFKSILRASESV